MTSSLNEPSEMRRETLDLITALKACRSKFEEYAILHDRKGTSEGEEKALVNQRMATLCDDAINSAALASRQPPSLELVEPSDAERANWSDVTADYVAGLEALAAPPSLERDGDLLQRGEVIAMLHRLADNHADLAIYGEEANARQREAMEAAFTHARCAVALMPAVAPPSLEREEVERALTEKLDQVADAGALLTVSEATDAILALASPKGGERGEGSSRTSPSSAVYAPLPVGSETPSPAGFEALAAEFAKPQFMTTTSGPGSQPGTRRHSLNFTFVDEGDSTEGRERRDALHHAMIAAAKAVNS